MIASEGNLHAAAYWPAELALEFTRREARTLLRGVRHRGPLRVQKALYPEGEAVCQAIVLHPPSGIVGGDQLQIGARLGPGAHAQLTTPGAGKWYRSAGLPATQAIDFDVGSDATLEWLPQETIVFDGARAAMSNRVTLAADGRYFGWDLLCLGRRAAGERFTSGGLTLHTRLERCGAPLWIERGRIMGDDPLLASAAGWAGASVCGTLLATLASGADAAPLLDSCRAIAPADGALHGISALPALLVARYLGDNSEAARLWFVALWQLLRPALLDRPALPPRIWST